VIFGGHPTARIFAQPLNPERGSVYNAYWSVQNKGVLLLQRLRATNARGHRIWFDNALQRSEQSGWVFAEAPRAYAAVRAVTGETVWEPDDVKQHREGKGRTDLGVWLSCRDELAPVIVEVVRKSDVADLAQFRAAVLSNALQVEPNRVTYRSAHYETTLTLFPDYSGPPLVDGNVVDYRPEMVYDSPFIRSEFGSGVVEIRGGGERLLLDFNREERTP
jgi:hypothetical protein